MLHVHPVTSLDEHPNLQPYRTMRRQTEHRQQGIFVAEGEKVVRRLLESNFIVVSLLLPEKWLHELEPFLNQRSEEIHAYTAEKEVLETLTGFSMYQGVLAVGKIPAPASLDQILKTGERPFLFAAVDGLTNAENLGTLVRNCAAFGVQALLVGETSGSPFLRRAVRSSMGGIFKVPVVEPASLVQTLGDLRAKKIRCIAAHPHTDRKTLAQANLATNCCIVFGSEGYGISPPVLNVCDEVVSIPMAAEVDSLNVGSAAAAFLYEAIRQRGKA
jgi:tRNA G18 (ribose-2'-O)-methylase SpoU